jgi:hypothetical protein
VVFIAGVDCWRNGGGGKRTIDPLGRSELESDDMMRHGLRTIITASHCWPIATIQ